VQKIGENISPRRIEMLSGDVVAAYVHSNNRVGALVALDGGTADLARDIAMHVTALNPTVVSRDDMPAVELSKEKDIIRAQPDMVGRPENIVAKMMTGRINKFLAENSLLEQPFVKNSDTKVGHLTKQAGVTTTSFTRMEVGEGIEVEKKDFAAEVEEQLQG
jgi:elongation factor Ts